jgi:hypothetical protein
LIDSLLAATALTSRAIYEFADNPLFVHSSVYSTSDSARCHSLRVIHRVLDCILSDSAAVVRSVFLKLLSEAELGCLSISVSTLASLSFVAGSLRSPLRMGLGSKWLES